MRIPGIHIECLIAILRKNAYIHEQITKGFGIMNTCISRFGIRIVDRKYLNEYTPFISVCLWNRMWCIGAIGTIGFVNLTKCFYISVALLVGMSSLSLRLTLVVVTASYITVLPNMVLREFYAVSIFPSRVSGRGYKIGPVCLSVCVCVCRLSRGWTVWCTHDVTAWMTSWHPLTIFGQEHCQRGHVAGGRVDAQEFSLYI